jgi:hypothetical protein
MKLKGKSPRGGDGNCFTAFEVVEAPSSPMAHTLQNRQKRIAFITSAVFSCADVFKEYPLPLSGTPGDWILCLWPNQLCGRDRRLLAC